VKDRVAYVFFFYLFYLKVTLYTKYSCTAHAYFL